MPTLYPGHTVYKTCSKPWTRVRTGTLTWCSKTPNYPIGIWPKIGSEAEEHWSKPAYAIRINRKFKLYHVKIHEQFVTILFRLFPTLLTEWLLQRGYDGYMLTKTNAWYPHEIVYVLLVKNPNDLSMTEPVKRDMTRYAKYKFGYIAQFVWRKVIYFLFAVAVALPLHIHLQAGLNQKAHQLKLEYTQHPLYKSVTPPPFTIATWNVHRFKSALNKPFTKLPQVSILCLQECGRYTKGQSSFVSNHGGKQSCIKTDIPGTYTTKVAYDSVMVMFTSDALSVMNIHLSVKCAKKRFEAMKVFLSMFKPNGPAIILGDFNMTLFKYYTQEQWMDLQTQRPFDSEEELNALLEERGFTDVSPPSPTCWTKKKVDYIYINDDLRNTYQWCTWTDDMERQSDHVLLGLSLAC